MTQFSLSHLTVLDVGPPDLVSLAASAGFQQVGIRLAAPMPGGLAYPMRPGSAEVRATRQRMADLDVRISDIEVVRIAPETEVASYAALFEVGAELGARRVCVNVDDPERARVVDRFAALCDLAAPFGLSLDVEFMIWRPVARLEDARDVVTAAGRPNGFILIDALHLIRSGGQVSGVAQLDAQLIGSVQLCDAPLASPPVAEIVNEARGDRLLPGDGELPLLELLAILPAGTALSAEVPMTARFPAMSPLERASRVHDATKHLLQRVEQPSRSA